MTTRLTLVLSTLSDLERLGPSATCLVIKGHSFVGQLCFWAHSPEFSRQVALLVQACCRLRQRRVGAAE